MLSSDSDLGSRVWELASALRSFRGPGHHGLYQCLYHSPFRRILSSSKTNAICSTSAQASQTTQPYQALKESFMGSYIVSKSRRFRKLRSSLFALSMDFFDGTTADPKHRQQVLRPLPALLRGTTRRKCRMSSGPCRS